VDFEHKPNQMAGRIELRIGKVICFHFDLFLIIEKKKPNF
jgi:hypothetical protein